MLKINVFGRNRMVIISGTDSAVTLFDIACTIKMIQEHDKIKYAPVGGESHTHMIGYKCDDECQKDIASILGNSYPNLKFAYLNKK